MKTSDTIGKLAEALAKARKDFRPVLKKSTNPFFRAKYADLAEVIEATSDALVANGLSIVQAPGNVALVDGTTRIALASRLIHSSGEWLESEMSLPISKFDAQGAGSAITYARRYAYQSIVGVAAEPDDDGNIATGTAKVENGVVTVTQPEPKKAGRPKSTSVQTPNISGVNVQPPEKKSTSFPFGANQDSANPPNAPAPEQGSQPSSPVSPAANIHGLDVKDSDVPKFGQTKETPSTPEEQKAIKERLHTLLPDGNARTKLFNYMKNRFKVTTLSELSMARWNVIFDELGAGTIKEVLPA